MKAQDVMSTPVVSIAPGASVHELAVLLLDRHISGVPVLEGGRLIGMVGEGDLVHRYEIGTDELRPHTSWWQRLVGADPGPGAYVRSHCTRVADVMTADLRTIRRDTPLGEVATIFESREVRRLPVLENNGELAGIVTRSDLLRAFAAKCRSAAPGEALDDDAIRTRLLAELERQPWWHPAWSAVSVQGGVVRFTGAVGHGDDQQAARIAAENIPGVRRVQDDRVRTVEWQPMM